MTITTMHRTIGTLALASALASSPQALAVGGGPYTISGDFSEGCYGMCLCVVAHIGELQGSFTLVEYKTLGASRGPVLNYQIIDVDLSIVSGTLPTRHFTGIGSYIIVNGIIVTQQLTFDLTDDKGEALHLDSGMIPGGEAFPVIDISIQHVLSPLCLASWFDINAAPAPQPDIADLNGDGVVNTLDLGILLNQWSSVSGILCGPGFCPADFNHDSVVDSIDLGLLLTHWTLK